MCVCGWVGEYVCVCVCVWVSMGKSIYIIAQCRLLCSSFCDNGK